MVSKINELSALQTSKIETLVEKERDKKGDKKNDVAHKEIQTEKDEFRWVNDYKELMKGTKTCNFGDLLPHIDDKSSLALLDCNCRSECGCRKDCGCNKDCGCKKDSGKPENVA